jgi:hypothetical protein
MNDAQQTETQRFAKTAASLLKEYSSKLDRMQGDMRRLREKHDQLRDKYDDAPFSSSDLPIVQQEYFALRHSFVAQEASLRKLAQRVSQRLEHASLDDVSRLELEVRLHELEAKLEQTGRLVDIGLPAHASA